MNENVPAARKAGPDNCPSEFGQKMAILGPSGLYFFLKFSPLKILEWANGFSHIFLLF